MRHIGRSLLVVLGLALATPARPCSRILWNDNGRAVLVGRNMDWKEDLKSNLWLLPRGMKRHGLAPNTVMTNEPTFDIQLENLKQYRGFGGEKRLPGTHEAADRFVRGAYYIKNMPKPKTEREAVAALMSVMRNTSAPFGNPDPERPNIAPTIWRTITDLTNGVLYYDGVLNPQVVWVDTKKLKFDAGESIRKLTVVGNFDLMGEVSGKFENTEMFKFLAPEK